MKVDREIRASKVRVIDENGEQLGVILLRDALERADEAGLNLVEIAPNADPPVCKIIDYGKFRYQKTKRDKDNRKSQHLTKMKEVKLKPNIDKNDLEVKINRAKKFLSQGHKVKFTCMFRGREIVHSDVGRALVDRICEQLEDIATPEAGAKMMGRSLGLVLAPTPSKNHNKGENSG